MQTLSQGVWLLLLLFYTHMFIILERPLYMYLHIQFLRCIEVVLYSLLLFPTRILDGLLSAPLKFERFQYCTMLLSSKNVTSVHQSVIVEQISTSQQNRIQTGPIYQVNELSRIHLHAFQLLCSRISSKKSTGWDSLTIIAFFARASADKCLIRPFKTTQNEITYLTTTLRSALYKIEHGVTCNKKSSCYISTLENMEISIVT